MVTIWKKLKVEKYEKKKKKIATLPKAPYFS
jgi:hypothetical protein